MKKFLASGLFFFLGAAGVLASPGADGKTCHGTSRSDSTQMTWQLKNHYFFFTLKGGTIGHVLAEPLVIPPTTTVMMAFPERLCTLSHTAQGRSVKCNSPSDEPLHHLFVQKAGRTVRVLAASIAAEFNEEDRLIMHISGAQDDVHEGMPYYNQILTSGIGKN